MDATVRCGGDGRPEFDGKGHEELMRRAGEPHLIALAEERGW